MDTTAKLEAWEKQKADLAVRRADLEAQRAALQLSFSMLEADEAKLSPLEIVLTDELAAVKQARESAAAEVIK